MIKTKVDFSMDDINETLFVKTSFINHIFKCTPIPTIPNYNKSELEIPLRKHTLN